MWLAVTADTDNSQAVALQTNVAAMGLRTWDRGANGWTGGGNAGAGQGQGQSGGAPMVPTTPLGLEVSLQLNGVTRNLVKVFLLGAV
jgi:hypothetical protein